MPLIESTYAVVMFNGKAFPGAQGIKPESPLQFLLALVPGNKFFKYMSVLWCYVFFVGFLFFRIRNKTLDWMHVFLTGMMFYGLVLYAAAFRKIEGHHFEMALQAQKFIYFFLVECGLLYLWGRQGLKQRRWALFLAAGVLLSSLLYALNRFDHRFTMVKWIKKDIFHKKIKGDLTLLDGQEISHLNMERARGHIVPRWQQEEITGVVDFLKANTSSGEKVFCYPEVGNFNFWADRPFVGKFPIGTFNWMYEPWYQESLKDFKEAKPRYVVMTHLGHRTFPEVWYFRNPRNKERFEEMTRTILDNYQLIRSFESVGIYERKNAIKAIR
jgi:hypothetical protein